MKKNATFFKAITLLLTMFSAGLVKAQKISCTLNMTTLSESFEYLSAGTRVNDVEADEGTATIDIGFTFRIGVCGAQRSATKVLVSSNGWMKLLVPGAATTAGAVPNSSSSAATTVAPSLAPWWTNMSGVGGEAKYFTQTLPSGLKIFTMEWKNWKWDPTATAASISFQVRLFEGSNVVEYHYKRESGSVASGAPDAMCAYIDKLPPPTVSETCYNYALISDDPMDGATFGKPVMLRREGVWGANLNEYPPTDRLFRFTQACCGKPEAGIVSQPDSVCAGAPFLAKSSGATPSPFPTFGVRYLWQTAPSSTGPWGDLGTDITQPFTGIYNDTFVRMIVFCDSSNESDTTPVKKITLIKLSYNCYCYSAATKDNNKVNIGNFKLIKKLNDTVYNNGDPNPAFVNKNIFRGYTLNTGITPTAIINRDSTYKYSVMGITSDSFAFSTSGVALYIDYDGDGVYNASSELAGFKLISGTSSSFIDSFTVPSSMVLDTFGMRVVMKKDVTSAADVPPCGDYDEGETEDYLLIGNYPVCPGPLDAGTSNIEDTAICYGYQTTIWNNSHAKNMSQMHWEWEYSLDNVLWANVPSSKFKDTLEPVVRQATYYRLRMVCDATKDTIYSNKVFIKLVNPANCYCYSLANGGRDLDTSDISTFQLGTFEMNTGGPHLKNSRSIRQRTDYTRLPPIELVAGKKYHIGVYHTMFGAHHADARITVFIDLNNNLKYDGASERIWTYVTSALDFFPTDSVTIPKFVISDVKTGLRVVLNDNISSDNPNDIGCDEFVSGEIEDYMVIIRRSSTGIEEFTNFDNLQIYPNPNKGAFSISFNAPSSIREASVDVTNITGQKVLSKQYTQVGNRFVENIQLNNAAPGIYFVTITADGQKVVQKLTIQ